MIIKIEDIGTHLELIDDSDQYPREIGQKGGNRSDDYAKYTRALIPKNELTIIEQATYVYIETTSQKTFKVKPSILGFTNTSAFIDFIKSALNSSDEKNNSLELIKEELKGVNKKLNKVLC